MKKFDHEQVTQTYRRYAPFYDRVFGGVLEGGRRLMCDSVRATEPQRLLEIGVGTGLTLFRYPSATHVTGIDISTEMLARAHLRAHAMPERRISLVRMNAEALAFCDGAFDCVTLPYVLSVTPDPMKLVNEARRVCRYGGDIFILNHFSGSRFWKPFEWMLGSTAGTVGFRSRFDYAENILVHDWMILSIRPVNVMGLSKLIHVRNV